MRYSILFLTACALGLAACQGDSPPASAAETAVALETAIPGRWETIELRTEVNSFEGRDTSYVEVISEGDWLRIFAMKPVRTTFHPDGTFLREHEMRTGEIIDRVEGRWGIYRDSILMSSPRETQRFGVSFENDKLVLQSRLDLDGDGRADDHYRSVHRLISRATR